MYIDGFRGGSIRGGRVLTEAFIVGANKSDNWFIQLAKTMADPGWGIWGKCPPPLHPSPCGGARHTSDQNSMPDQETHENVYILLQIHLISK